MEFGKRILWSLMIFGLTVLILSCSQSDNWKEKADYSSKLEQNNWKERQKIEDKNRRAERLFEKRSNLLSRSVYLMKMREQTIWNYWTANEYHLPSMGHWQKDQELIAQQDALIAECAFFFEKYPIEIIRNFKKATSIFHDLMYKMVREKVTEEVMNQKMNEAFSILNQNYKYFASEIFGEEIPGVAKSATSQSRIEPATSGTTPFIFIYPTPYVLPPEEKSLSGEHPVMKPKL